MKKSFLEFEDEDIAEKATGMLRLITKERQRIEGAGADYVGYLELALGLWIKSYMTVALPLMKTGNLKPARRGKKSGFEFIEKEIIRIANQIYHERHFEEVDRLIQGGYKHEAAYKKVADKYGFPWESFARQYRDRHANTITSMKKG